MGFCEGSIEKIEVTKVVAFTCFFPVDWTISGLPTPKFNSDRAQSDQLKFLHEGYSVSLSHQSNN